MFPKWILTRDVSPYFSFSERREPRENGSTHYNDYMGSIYKLRTLAKFNFLFPEILAHVPSSSVISSVWFLHEWRGNLAVSTLDFILTPPDSRPDASRTIRASLTVFNAFFRREFYLPAKGKVSWESFRVKLIEERLPNTSTSWRGQCDATRKSRTLVRQRQGDIPGRWICVLRKLLGIRGEVSRRESNPSLSCRTYK